MEKRKLVLTIIGVVILAMVIMVYIYFSKPGRDEKKNQQTINQVQTVQQKTNEKKENTEIMKEKNYQVWKKVYEDFYKIPLKYTCEQDN